jgi:MFS family permease
MTQTFPLYYSVFIAAVAVMALEIIGLGMLAPYFGTALIVQTNVIGIVLTSLAVGYRLGGARADRGVGMRELSLLLLTSALWVGVVFPFRDVVSSYIGSHIASVALGSLLAAGALFSFPSVILGMVLPYAIKIHTLEIALSGRSTGVLYALSTIGSIFGTLAVAFFLLPRAQYAGSLLVITGVLLVGAFLSRREKRLWVVGVATLSLLLLMFIPIPEFAFHKSLIFSEGKIKSNVTEWKRLAEETGVFSRLQVYEGTELASHRPLRFLMVNGEVHSATYLDSNELVFNYALYNRLGGHFNPAAKKALLIGGGAYSYANYFLTDTPLYDREKVWQLENRLYHNNKTVSLPVLFSNDVTRREGKRTLVYVSSSTPVGGQTEGEHNHIEVDNQAPSETVLVRRADIRETGFPDHAGYVHVHETNDDGTTGRIVSDDIPLDGSLERPRTIIGKGSLLRGENTDVLVPLERPAKEGEVLYAMLHRDNGNGHFDDFLVDGYEQIEALDVVEIDPRTTRLAETYFHLNREDPRLRIFHEDGRTFINRSQEKYDIIYIDAFRSFYAVPWQLTTIEATRKLFELMNEDGVLVANVPAALGGRYSGFFHAELKTYQAVFPEVRVYASFSPNDEFNPQNIIMVAFKSKTNIRETLNDDSEINKQLSHQWFGEVHADAPVLTDDYAPTDYFTGKFANIHTF